VVHVIDSLGPGGAENNLVNLLVGGDNSAFEHHVFGLYRDTTLASRLNDAGIPVTMLGGSGPRAAVSLIAALAPHIRAVDPQVVHTQLVMSDLVGRIAVLGGAARSMLSTLQNRPYDPEAIGTEFRSATIARVIRRLDRWLGKRTRTRYLAVSESVRSSYIRELRIDPEQIDVLYNSVDLGHFGSEPLSGAERQALRSRLGLDDVPLLLNVARHTPQKGLNHLIEAMASPVVRASGARLLLVGEGPDTPLLRERMGTLGLENQVSLLGRRSDVRELMAVSDAFVLPSVYEGLPLALLEALAMGLPVVASDLPEIREVTTEQGAQLVPPCNPERLAEAIAHVLAAPDAGIAAARVGRRQIADRFDLRTNASRFADALRRTAR
jgi:glycosyltransferase involved in cell wall biosynthesis